MAIRSTTDLRREMSYDEPTGYYRFGALAALAVVTLVSIRILYDITVILGGSIQLLLGVVASIAAAWLVARRFPVLTALWIFGGLVIVSYLWYIATVSGDLIAVLTSPIRVLFRTLNDTITILTGLSVLTIGETGVWARSFAPAPIFLAWYLGFRRHYALAAGIAGGTMLLFVFSGDLGWQLTLIGALATVALVGLGTLESREASVDHVEWLVILIAIMATTAMLIPLVPGGGAMGPLTFIDHERDQGDLRTVESAVVGADDQLSILGEVDLSPTVRYTIESGEDVHWRTGAYDRYTGEGWVRSGNLEPFAGPRTGPENGTPVQQEVRIESRTTRLPAATRATSIEGVPEVSVSEHGTFVADRALEPGTTYQVTSVLADPAAYDPTATVPEHIQSRYTQLPENVPARVGALTDELLAGTDDPIEQAQIIEAWLEQEKTYSLNVTRPSGDIADAFIFEMEAGYCTYFATAMTVMLRSADVPARMAVGYAQGQEVDDGRYVVRGMNSHAWVEVYVAGVGWMTFDPTPAGPRTGERATRLEQAREEAVENVDTDDSVDLPFDHDPSPDTDETNGTNETDANDPDDPSLIGGTDDPIPNPEEVHDFGIDLSEFRLDTTPTADESDDDDGLLPNPEVLGLLAMMLLGITAGIHRVDGHERVRRQLCLRWHLRPDGSIADIERSLERAEWVLAARYRPRRPHETRRTYLRLFAMTHEDERVDRLFHIAEQARFGGNLDETRAAEAVALADALVADQVRLGGRVGPFGR